MQYLFRIQILSVQNKPVWTIIPLSQCFFEKMDIRCVFWGHLKFSDPKFLSKSLKQRKINSTPPCSKIGRGAPPAVEIPVRLNTRYVPGQNFLDSQPIWTIFGALESTGSLLSKTPKIIEISSEMPVPDTGFVQILTPDRPGAGALQPRRPGPAHTSNIPPNSS